MRKDDSRSWEWQLAHRITLLEEFAVQNVCGIEYGMRRAAEKYPFAVTPYYASLIKEATPRDPIFRQCVPDAGELVDDGLADDELCETRYSPVPGLIHRYPNRVVVLASSTCPTYCRHCTRKRLVGKPAGSDIRVQAKYVRSHPEINDVIISGGEPLMLPTARLAEILREFRAVPSVEIIRIGTRAPATLPMRIDDELCDLLAEFHPVWVNTHFNHAAELTDEAAAACDRLLRRGIPLNNQCVLLKGVNDTPDAQEALCRALLHIRVRPYYLLQCDPVAGTSHFRTPLARGIEIITRLHERIGGLGVPRYVVDAVAGGGKIPIAPGITLGEQADNPTLRLTE